MKTDNILLIVAVIAVVISIVGAGITYNYLTAFRNKLTGFATEGGMVNLSVESTIAINFTYNMINWSNGSVDTGKSYALLDTTNQTGAEVTDGSWTGVHTGLVIENIGNKNVTLDLISSKDNETMIGGTDPQFAWWISNNDTDVSCKFGDGGEANNTWYPVNTSGPDGSRICDYFYFESDRDQIEIDFFVRIPDDSITGDTGSTITATFSAA